MKTLALAVMCFFAACKSSDETTTTAPTDKTDTTAKAPTRNGKIDMPQMKRNRQHVDTDGDGDIDDQDKPAPGADPEAMRKKFDEMRKAHESKLDTDGDGKISEEERTKARHERAEQMHARFDADGDGKLTKDEIAASGRMSRRLGDIDKVDTNKDGVISTDEIDAAMASRPQGFAAGNGALDRWRGERGKRWNGNDGSGGGSAPAP